MLKIQLSRVPWPGNSWIPHNFQDSLQKPHKQANNYIFSLPSMQTSRF